VEAHFLSSRQKNVIILGRLKAKIMDANWQTFGHEKAKKILNKQLESQIFPHAYLFLGPAGVGKKTLALELARKILQTGNAEIHPDFQILDLEGEIIIEAIREFATRLSYKPFSGKYKVALLANVQNLNEESGNALLKTLEEPSPSTILILVADGRKLLPTIISRCQVINFNAFTIKQLRAYAKANNLEADTEALEFAFGSTGRLHKLLTDAELLSKQQQIIKRLELVNNGTSLAEKLLAIKELAVLEDADLENTLQMWLNFQRHKLTGSEAGFKSLAAISQALINLKTNRNRQLILQTLFLQV
jgi:DNA polymerase-3 subunit delta'